jgi:hypothetical protein
MDRREQALVVFENLLRPLSAVHNLKLFKRDIDFEVTDDYMPCLLIIEGEDRIIKETGRSYLVYPCIREVDIAVEVWDFSTSDIRQMRKNVILYAFANGPKLLQDVVIKEVRTIGPINHGIPKVLGMQIHFLMTYPDNTIIT